MHVLDNPIWTALTSRQAHFAEGNGLARRFPSEVTTLAGFPEPTTEGYESLGRLPDNDAVMVLFLDAAPKLPPGWVLEREFPLYQMVLDEWKGQTSVSGVSELTVADVPEMVALADLTKPGPFGTRTRELGTYLGVRQDGRLAAMAGERLRVPGYTEVSAVCTHPDYLGRGHARALMAAVVDVIRGRGETPFLHVREDNTRAVELYRRLGFKERKLFQTAVVRREEVRAKSA